MKKLSIIACALVFLAVSTAMAGDYHTTTTLNCAECHVMHYSQTHGYNNDGTGLVYPLANGPHDYLLRNEVNALCLSCHDNQTFAPDVLAANGGSSPTNGRQGGALNRDNTAPYFDATGHTLGSTDVAPGGTFTNANGLNCVDCHRQHGAVGAYRNLRTPSGDTLTYAIGVNDLSREIFELSASMGGDHYDIQNVHFNEPDQTKSGYAAVCKVCHTDFHGSSSDPNMRNTAGPAGTEWYRHPTADVTIGAAGGGHSQLSRYTGKAYRVHVMTNGNDWGPWGAAWTASPADLTPSCMSCHKGHGGTNPFGLIFATGAANPGENGPGPFRFIILGQPSRTLGHGKHANKKQQ